MLKTLPQSIADGDDIECVIRQTGINQNGHSSLGLTVPSAAAQTELIRSTYKKCGLECASQDRCQYFEAHGTGTLAGDPKEAEAMRDAFFPVTEGQASAIPDTDGSSTNEDEHLYVGSVKTVIGHTEGAAGLVSLLKASLAVQHAEIPPNMHFDRLNPTIQPFYKSHFSVPTRLIPWPKVPTGAPRRVSINSFGFGGTNAHAIVESWNADSKSDHAPEPDASHQSSLITLSARTECSLRRTMKALSAMLKRLDGIDMHDLAWTLRRRTEFSVKASFSAIDKADLLQKLDSATNEIPKERRPDSVMVTKPIKVSEKFPLRVLGVFTGQGAQWPSMGAELYCGCDLFRESITQLDGYLSSLPDAPDWSLAKELTAPEASSRVQLSHISQPLTTAIQIGLHDLLNALGIPLAAVVGHSSGEIAALYAAGFISAEDAIRISFYRGAYSHLARSSAGIPGKMIAVKMTADDAIEFCQRPQFRGRVTLAAQNSKTNVTLSGDADAIDEAKMLLDEAGVVVKNLQVQVAYHSHHMESITPHYLASLRRAGIRPQPQPEHAGTRCNWFSSVYGPDGRGIEDLESFRDIYWVENLVRPVLFHQAVERVVREDFCFDLAFEIGPHPALKGAVTETFMSVAGINIPYCGFLKRGENAITTFADALGFLWKNVNPSNSVMDLNGFMRSVNGAAKLKGRLVKGLPSYSWDHDVILYKESRHSSLWRDVGFPPHELLGKVVWHGQGDREEVHWRNTLKLDEIPWLRGHQFQYQVLFPAAGCLSMAVDAAVRLASQQPVMLVELRDVEFLRAISLDEQLFPSGTEIHFTMKVVSRDVGRIIAAFSCYSNSADADVSQGQQSLDQVNFIGQATIRLGHSDQDELPPRKVPKLPLKPVNTRRFYSWASKIGLQYAPPFLAESIHRRLNQASVSVPPSETDQFCVHPAVIDTAFHGLFAAYSFPGDGRMRVPYLPSKVDMVRVDTSRCTSTNTERSDRTSHEHTASIADCHLRSHDSTVICGDVDIFCGELLCRRPRIQVQGLKCAAIAPLTVEDDRQLFARMDWRRDISSGLGADDLSETLSLRATLYEKCERTAYFFLRSLHHQISQDEIPSLEWHFQCLMTWTSHHMLPKIEMGRHPRVRPEWSKDDLSTIMRWRDEHPDSIDLQFLHSIGSSLSAVVRGSLPILQLMIEDDALEKFYNGGLGFSQGNRAVGCLVGQLSHRYPRTRVLEIGAGTGATTRVVMPQLGTMGSYTFTDISPSFFEKAQEAFPGQNVNFQVLDIERSPVEQGFETHSFDLIIASNVLHATRCLSDTLLHCRQLLRPGGRMILMELTSEALYLQLMFSSLPGWWLGQGDGRTHHPTTPESHWEMVLKQTGFSGLDYTVRDTMDSATYVMSVMVSQAVDSRVDILRQPLFHGHAAGAPEHRIESLVVIGGDGPCTRRTAQQIQSALTPFSSKVEVINKLEDCLQILRLGPQDAVVCLAELDRAVLDGMTEDTLSAIKRVLSAGHVLWVTKGCRSKEPLKNMMVGIGRSAMMETSHIRIQFAELTSVNDKDTETEAKILCEMLLRMILLDLDDYSDIVWSNETEVVIDDGMLVIPRVRPDVECNSRLNAGSRVIKKDIQLSKGIVEIIQNDGARSLQELIDITNRHRDPDLIQVQVQTSSLYPLRTFDSEPMYLCLGSDSRSQEQVLAISSTNSSTLRLPPENVMPWSLHSQLSDLLAYLFSHSLFSRVPNSGTIWLHDADNEIITSVSNLAVRRSINVLFTSSSPVPGPDITFVHEHISQRDLELILPKDLRILVSFSPQGNHCLEDALPARLRSRIIVQYATRDVIRENELSLGYGMIELQEVLREYNHKMAKGSDILGVDSGSVNLENVCQLSAIHTSLTTVVDWRTTGCITVVSSPIPYRGLFDGQKTYFLAGLTGDIGLSIIEWMTNHGARHFAVASRRPRISSATVEHLRGKGADLKILKLDITDKTALWSAFQKLRKTMPPIAGVANASMVLNDATLERMSLEKLQDVLHPKVQGSQNLDELFHVTDLEFFVMFSSMASIAGNPGQSNYGAANMFISSLALQRRNRGLAASVVHLGAMQGLGYFSNTLDTESVTESQIHRLGLAPLSEADLHTIFAEAIVTGRPESGRCPGLFAGFEKRISGHNTDLSPRLCQIPLFSHYFQESDSIRNVEGITSRASAYGIRSQLVETRGPEEALGVVEAAFSLKLGLILHTGPETIGKNLPLISLGIDSLVAVEIRSWFLKELSVDLPIFRILSGASLQDICRDVISNLEGVTFGCVNGSSTPCLTPCSTTPRVSLEKSPMLRRSQPDLDSLPTTEDTVQKKTIVCQRGNNRGSITDFASPTHEHHTEYERVGNMGRSQAQLYFLHQYLEDKSAYTVAHVGRFDGELSLTRLESALHAVSKQNEALRSSYFMHQSYGRAVQAVNADPRIMLYQRRIDGVEELENEIASQRNFVFDIEHGLTMKVTVLSECQSVHHIIFLYHHIILDGWSWFLFTDSLQRAYAGQSLERCIQQPIDMSAKEGRRLESKRDTLLFWEGVYRDTEAYNTTPLWPFSKTANRQILKVHDAETFDLELPTHVTKLVRERASTQHVTPFHIHLSALAIFLSQSLDIENINIGIAHAKRPDTEDGSTMGYFLNMIPLRFHLENVGNETFSSFTQRTRDMVMATTSGSSLPLDVILDHLQLPRSASHHPLFQVVLNFRQGYATETPLGGGGISWYMSSNRTITARNPFDMAFDITEVSNKTFIHLTTHKYMYESSDSRFIMRWYTQAVEALCRNPSAAPSSVPLFTEDDLHHALSLGEGSSKQVEWRGTLVHRIEAMAMRRSDCVALVDGYGHRLTYFEMMARVRRIACFLRSNSRALPSGSYVAVLLEPSAEQVCALLAVLRLGLVYVPLDLRNPPGRLDQMLSDCRPSALLCNTATQKVAAQLDIHSPTTILDLDLISSLAEEVDGGLSPISSDLAEPAIIIYTSGSTGVPKGVIISHRNIIDYIYSATTLYGVGDQDVVLQQSSLGFDMSLDQTFMALSNGAMLIIAGKYDRGDPLHLARLIRSENVTYTFFSQTECLSLLHHGNNVLRQCDTWRLAVHGGEKLTPQLLTAFRRLNLPRLRLVHAYGPTECAIACASSIQPYDIHDDDAQAASGCSLWPMPNHSIIIADHHMGPVPVGFPGEICVSGAGVSLGYVSCLDETRRRFGQLESFGWAIGKTPAQKRVYYRTGDLGRLLPDGSLQILGRLPGDSQVKIRGQRVELDEIANVIVRTADGAILDAAVSYRSELDLLVAFVVYDAALVNDKTEFPGRLIAMLPLPLYMRPTLFIPIDSIPVSITGKQDRATVDRLPFQGRGNDQDAILASDGDECITDIELQMKAVWLEVLSRHRAMRPTRNLIRSSDFFEVGGNSMLMVELRSLLQRQFGVTTTLPQLFQMSKLSAMSAHIEFILNSEVSPQPSAMDWDAEVESLYRNLRIPSPTDITSAGEQDGPGPRQRGLKVVLTGATGFLGTHVAHQLVQNPAVEAVCCVAIRVDEDGNPRHVAVKSSKIVEYSGNLVEPRLGLSEDDFNHLGRTTDIIIHNGAAVSFLQSYNSLRSANVVSTGVICELAVRGRIPIHFISSASVAAVSQTYDPEFVKATALPPISVSKSAPQYDAATARDLGIHGYGYGLTKWVSEALLERVGDEYGLPVFIHRPVSIVGPGAPAMDFMAAILGFSHTVGAAPAMGRLRICGSFDMMRVEEVSEILVGLILRPNSGPASRDIQHQQPMARFVHYCNEAKVKPDELADYIGKFHGCAIGVLGMKEWLDAALRRGLSEPLYHFLRGAFEDGKRIVLPLICKD